MPRDAVFLDRDGTIIEEVNYLARPEQVRLLPHAAEAIREWNAAGVLVIVVTNQAGVARGYFPEARIGEVHAHLDALLAASGAKVDAYYYCPHGPNDGCACRKPLPGMLHLAAREHDIDLSRSWVIGDKVSDSDAGRAAGCRAVLVRTGHGLPACVEGAEVVADLRAALELWKERTTSRNL